MSRKREPSLNQIQRRDEVTVFLERTLQWLCNLQTEDIELFDEQRIAELGQTIAKKLGVLVFCDLDRNYRKAHNLRILVDEKGRVPSVSKERTYHTVLKVSQFEVRVDISRKGGFFCLRSYTISQTGNTSIGTQVEARSKYLLKVCDQVAQFLESHGLIQVPDTLLSHPIDGRNELDGEVTLMTKLFGEI
jgi:hypothetical protein